MASEDFVAPLESFPTLQPAFVIKVRLWKSFRT